jgi:hypothetical protein
MCRRTLFLIASGDFPITVHSFTVADPENGSFPCRWYETIKSILEEVMLVKVATSQLLLNKYVGV